MSKKRVYSRLINSLTSSKKKVSAGKIKSNKKINKNNNKFNKNNNKFNKNPTKTYEVLQLLKLYKSQPISLKILTSYMLVIAAMYVLFAIYPASLLFGALLGDSLARILNISLFIAILFIFYGIIARKYWAWQLAIMWFSFEILNSLGSVILSNSSNLLSRYVNTGAFYIMVINFIILWFLYKKKDVFTGRISSDALSANALSADANAKLTSNLKSKLRGKIAARLTGKKAVTSVLRAEDKVFVFSFSILVVLLAILVSSSITTVYLETITLSKAIVPEINHKSLEQAVFLCNSKSAQEKDVCNVVLAVAYKDQINADFGKEFCNDAEFSFYKITCLKALE
ncbi:hypothetical protein HYU06_01695 [Candidatus Woesearchaeota archaeon]|nr:hypothetical protein [Candidatus Woesearchaeota archaeon]